MEEKKENVAIGEGEGQTSETVGFREALAELRSPEDGARWICEATQKVEATISADSRVKRHQCSDKKRTTLSRKQGRYISRCFRGNQQNMANVITWQGDIQSAIMKEEGIVTRASLGFFM